MLNSVSPLSPLSSQNISIWTLPSRKVIGRYSLRKANHSKKKTPKVLMERFFN